MSSISFVVSTASSLAAVISIEFAKINNYFFTLFCVLKILIGIITLFFAVKIFDIGDVLLFFHFDDVDIYCRKIMATTLVLPFIASKTFLIILVFFAKLALVDRRLLGLLLTR